MAAIPTAPASSDERQRREVIRQVGAAIGDMAKHMSSGADIAAAAGTVSARAKAIAFKAWQIIAGSRAPERVARELVADLSRLAEDMGALSGRAGKEAVVSQEAASLLLMAASEFAAIANDPNAAHDATSLRARLRPLMANLETIPQRLLEGKVIAEAFAQTAKTASSLAARGKHMSDAGPPGQALQSLYDGITTLAEQTGSLSVWITANAERSQRAATMVASSVALVSCARLAPQPPAATQPQPVPQTQSVSQAAAKTEQLSAIVSRGAAVVW
jgi:hypothetical protein